ncbi:late competence development ComFB family protein [Gloeothece verrucosa]|uniref:Late competence development protein ComFB n=1 Tax=Gloeothece verrucosa (strain PCC 7822) TaxID=497965 RepID=E0UCY3_GLOV7|nr:late competence development ComFB family protein [Gloeothece verrucosa]ADN16448.1 Late competence development protein ComFB [Gloeothece verrucosa PCC 7822]
MNNLSQTEEPQAVNQSCIHINVMEVLVQQEIEKQLRDYSCRLKPYLNRVEVATFALNRLPALYASTIDGKNYQIALGKKYQQQITLAVRRAIAAVERDPLRTSKPIVSEAHIQYQKAKKALQELQLFLQQKGLLAQSSISCKNLVMVVHYALKKVSWSQRLKSQGHKY